MKEHPIPVFGYFYQTKPELIFQTEGIGFLASESNQGIVLRGENKIEVLYGGLYEIIFSVLTSGDDVAIVVNGGFEHPVAVFGRTKDKERISAACLVRLEEGDQMMVTSLKSKVFTLPALGGQNASLTIKKLPL